jgi:hypothetical protein
MSYKLTDKAPTEPGYYWANNGDENIIIKVEKLPEHDPYPSGLYKIMDDGSRCYMHEEECALHICNFKFWSDRIEEPEEKIEIERFNWIILTDNKNYYKKIEFYEKLQKELFSFVEAKNYHCKKISLKWEEFDDVTYHGKEIVNEPIFGEVDLILGRYKAYKLIVEIEDRKDINKVPPFSELSDEDYDEIDKVFKVGK